MSRVSVASDGINDFRWLKYVTPRLMSDLDNENNENVK